MEALLRDLRYAVRVLVRNPGFTVVAVLTLSLGIGLTTVVFSLVNAVLLRPLPVADPGSLVTLREELASGDPADLFTLDRYRAYAAESRVFTPGVAAFGMSDLSLNTGSQPEVVTGSFVSGNYFQVLGIAPARGRFFGPQEDQGAGVPVAVISHDLWRRRFASDPAVIGRTVTLNSQPMIVVGVAPEKFRGTVAALPLDVWVPLSTFAQVSAGSDEQTIGIVNDGRNTWLTLFGRLREGVTREQAAGSLGALARQLPRESANAPRVTRVGVEPLGPLPAGMKGQVIGFMALLMATAGLVLLIASVNVAGMLLARAAARPREIAIRLAVGAQRGRLITQFLAEGLLLFLLGGAGGILLAVWVSRLLTAFSPLLTERTRLDLSLDLRVLAFTLLVSLATGVGFSLVPALQASRPALVPSLKSASAVGGRKRSRLRNGFVIGQIAASLLLLVVAGLFVRALRTAVTSDPGFDPDGVVIASVDLSPYGYGEERGREFYRQLVERVGALPGVSAAAVGSAPPLNSDYSVQLLRVPGYQPPPNSPPSEADYEVVSPGYFAALGIPVTAGRTFAETDASGSPPVVVINQAMARRFWPRESPIGKRIGVGRQEVEVVGVAGNTVHERLGEAPHLHLYFPFAQRYRPQMALHVRAAGETAPVIAAVRREVQALDRNVPLQGLMPLSQRLDTSLLPQRLAVTLIGTFGMLGLVLAAVGLYGIVAYSVSQRTYEIGVRLALGARPGDVLRMVVRQGLKLTLIGMGVGLALALLATQLLARLLYGVSPTDLVTFLGVSLLLVGTALLASYLPARRAARISPMLALRAE